MGALYPRELLRPRLDWDATSHGQGYKTCFWGAQVTAGGSDEVVGFDIKGGRYTPSLGLVFLGRRSQTGRWRHFMLSWVERSLTGHRARVAWRTMETSGGTPAQKKKRERRFECVKTIDDVPVRRPPYFAGFGSRQSGTLS